VKRRFRLRHYKDIKRVRQLGKSVALPLLVLVVSPSPQPGVRIGVVTNRTIGNAVVRNRTRRRIRACASLFYPILSGNWDVLFLARRPAALASFAELKNTMFSLLKRGALLQQVDVLSVEKMLAANVTSLVDVAPIISGVQPASVGVQHSDDE
jgi:ribonuclease P protein component